MKENIKYLWGLVKKSFENDPSWKIFLKYLIIKLVIVSCLIFVPIGVVLLFSGVTGSLNQMGIIFIAYLIGFSLLRYIIYEFIKFKRK